MKKHLKYIDGSSDKFWQIEVSGTSFTVTYGKNGTSGVSQTKQFDTAEECLKTAEKLLAEKEKKGYSENGEVVIASPVAKEKSGSNKDVTALLKEYDEVMLSGKKELLLPFLEQNAKGNIEVLKKHIRKCKRHYMEWIDLNKENGIKNPKKWDWGTRGTPEQKEIILLSIIALFNKSEVNDWELLALLEKYNDPNILGLLVWAKPNWIDFFILDQIKKNEWTTFSYNGLRFLEEKNLIEFNPELYALCLANYAEWREKISAPDFIRGIVDDKLACERDVPELFNYQTNIHNSSYKIEEKEGYRHSTWELGYKLLLEEKKMQRPFFIENTIHIQTKEWNNNLKSFFRKRLDNLNPSADDLIPFQENIFAFLHNPYPPITTYAIDLIKKIYEHPKFKAKVFLEWLEPMMMRTDCKAAIKAVLPMLEKLSKANPKLNKNIASVVADVYMIADLNLQERATKLIVKTASKKDNEVIDKLTSYAPLIQGSVKSSLSSLLNEEVLALDTDSLEEYSYNPEPQKVLLEKVTMPKEWNDIIYLFGEFISSDEPLATEKLLNVYVTQRGLFPSNFNKQLEAYTKQLERGHEAIHKIFATVFFKHKTKSIVQRISIQDNTYSKIKTLKLINRFINKVQDKIDKNSVIPLLSFPTHAPYWVEPKVLLQRIIHHQQTQEPIMALDLAVAIARMPRENIEEALPLLDRINGEIKDVLAFCLGVKKEIAINTGSFLNRLATSIGIGTQNAESIALWAVAARTHYPEETFEIFNKTHLSDMPFVTKAFNPEIKIIEHKGMIPPNRIEFIMPYNKKPEEYLIYSLDMYSKEQSWWHGFNAAANVAYWHSLMPQNSNPLALELLYNSFSSPAGSNQDYNGYLTVVNQPGFRLTDSTTLAYACCFMHEKKDIRILATEILINLVDKRAIDIKILANKFAFLLNGSYGSLGRLVDALATIKDVSPLHNHALYLLLDAIFGTLDFGDKLPTNFKKMVENYADILSKTNQKPSSEAVAFFQKWKDNATLKPLLKEIIK